MTKIHLYIKPKTGPKLCNSGCQVLKLEYE